MNELTHPDSFHLQAAVGWLELGSWREANEELELISPRQRAHPDVLQVRCKIYDAAQRWALPRRSREHPLHDAA